MPAKLQTEATVNPIGNGIVLLMQHPEQLARLREGPDLWPAAITRTNNPDYDMTRPALQTWAERCAIRVLHKHPRARYLDTLDHIAELTALARRRPHPSRLTPKLLEPRFFR
jgi:hypothetical protein